MINKILLSTLLVILCSPSEEANAGRRHAVRVRQRSVVRVQHRPQSCPPCKSGQCDPNTDPDFPADSQATSVHPAQQIAITKARYMASRGIGGHHLMHLNARIPGYCFEGSGWSSGGNPPTCTPGFNCHLAGDAIARAHNGMTYRVRIWTRYR